MESLNFEIDFVNRTKQILSEYKGPNDMSIIINCSLGLIILPNERLNNPPPNSIWVKEIENIPHLPSFEIKQFEPIHKITKGQKIYYPKTLEVFLRKVRNGLAHQNIEPVNKDGAFVGVILKNYFETQRPRTQVMDLEVKFSQQQLKDFAMFIANQYLGN